MKAGDRRTGALAGMDNEEKAILAILVVTAIGIAAAIYFDVQRQDACIASGKHWIATQWIPEYGCR